MTRFMLGLVMVLLFAGPVAAKPLTPTATLSVDDPNPAWGQFITLTADANVSGTFIYCEFVHSGGTSFSSSVYDYTAEPYSDDVGLYAPNWPTGAVAEATCEVRLVYKFHGKTTIDGSGLTFAVAGA